MPKLTAIVAKLTIFLPVIFLSCSLNYGDTESSENLSPEFSFDNSFFIRTKDTKEQVCFTADKIEQYTDNDAMYGTNINFSTFNEQGNETVNGSCDLFSANNQTKLYQFFGNINIYSYEKDIGINAENLRWNGKTQTLVSTEYDTITITTNGAVITGTGFSASEKDSAFSLLKDISGTIKSTGE